MQLYLLYKAYSVSPTRHAAVDKADNLYLALSSKLLSHRTRSEAKNSVLKTGCTIDVNKEQLLGQQIDS